jgi:hypothetical protein
MAIRPHLPMLLALFVGACGGEEAPTLPAPRFGELAVVEGAPDLPADPGVEPTALVAAGSVTALGAAGTTLMVGTDSHAAQLIDGALEPLEVWSDDPSAATSTGEVKLVTRAGATLVVLADEGLFHSFGDKLVPSPASAEVVALEPLAMHADGDALWLCTPSGLARLEGEELSWLTVEGEAGAPAAVHHASSGLFYVAFDDRLYEIEDGEAFAVPYDLGAVHAISAGSDEAIYVASDRGLFERTADGAWTQYTLSASAEGAPATALSFYPKDGVFAAVPGGIALVQPDSGVTGVVQSDATRMIADDVGQLWLAAGSGVTGLAVGTPIGFEDDVAPILTTYCASCHDDGSQNAPVQNFADYDNVVLLAQTVVSRIQAGQMPPSGSDPMPGDAVDLINRWYLSGQNP